jgi:hypothetical protein
MISMNKQREAFPFLERTREEDFIKVDSLKKFSGTIY